ncbi:unnamed protein product [Caenorhabditis brenneri]
MRECNANREGTAQFKMESVRCFRNQRIRNSVYPSRHLRISDVISRPQTVKNQNWREAYHEEVDKQNLESPLNGDNIQNMWEQHF